MVKAVDITGERFGRLTALSKTDKRKWGLVVWDLKCDCGNMFTATGSQLNTGNTKSCGCLREAYYKSRFKDITGSKFTRLTAVSCTGEKDETGRYMWNFICDCGETYEGSSYKVTTGVVKSCGCLMRECREGGTVTHGKSKTPAYASWLNIKSRVCDPGNRLYHIYSELGMCEDLKADFLKLEEYLGTYPSDGKKHSVDRIDNSLGYFKGNMRWATAADQNRNKGMNKRNKSGVTGVNVINDKHGAPVSYQARYYWDGEHTRKLFNIKKLGEELAFFAACEYREVGIMRLNLLGAGYTKTHGTPCNDSK